MNKGRERETQGMTPHRMEMSALPTTFTTSADQLHVMPTVQMFSTAGRREVPRRQVIQSRKRKEWKVRRTDTLSKRRERDRGDSSCLLLNKEFSAVLFLSIFVVSEKLSRISHNKRLQASINFGPLCHWLCSSLGSFLLHVYSNSSY